MGHVRITEGKGFAITFANGVTLSVQFGAGNYGTNHSSPLPDRDLGASGASEVEIAIWRNDGAEWFDFGRNCFAGRGADVLGYVSVDELPKWMSWCASQGPAKED